MVEQIVTTERQPLVHIWIGGRRYGWGMQIRNDGEACIVLPLVWGTIVTMHVSGTRWCTETLIDVFGRATTSFSAVS